MFEIKNNGVPITCMVLYAYILNKGRPAHLHVFVHACLKGRQGKRAGLYIFIQGTHGQTLDDIRATDWNWKSHWLEKKDQDLIHTSY